MLGAVVNSTSCIAGFWMLPCESTANIGIITQLDAGEKKKRKKPQRIKAVIKITLLGLHTRKWTSNHPANPDNLVRSMLMLNTTFDLTLRISSTVAVIQSISLMTAEVPITWLGWRLFHNEVWKFKATTDKKLYPKKTLTSSYNMSLKEEKTKDVRV